MSSNIRVQKHCQHCGEEFTAKTTKTRYCGDTCAKRAYKKRKRAEKINVAEQETAKIKVRSLHELQSKEFLTVREVAKLLSCSIRTVYYQIENGRIKAVNLGERMTRVRRSEIDKLFE